MKNHQHQHQHSEKPYTGLAVMTAIHFIFMLAMSYLMVDVANDIFLNLNSLYMALWMVAPSVVVMLVLMKSMYPKETLNKVLIVLSTLIFVLSFLFIREQTLVGDTQFLRSMIPHHSGAVLMCEKAEISDPEIQALCKEIINGQKQEIEQMNSILKRLNQ